VAPLHRRVPGVFARPAAAIPAKIQVEGMIVYIVKQKFQQQNAPK
jgi:hypothetical protein